MKYVSRKKNAEGGQRASACYSAKRQEELPMQKPRIAAAVGARPRESRGINKEGGMDGKSIPSNGETLKTFRVERREEVNYSLEAQEKSFMSKAITQRNTIWKARSGCEYKAINIM